VASVAAAALPPVVSAEAAIDPAPVPGHLDLAGLWIKVVDAVSRASPFARTYYLEAHPVSLVRNVFTIGYAPEFGDHLGLVDNQKNRTLVQTKLDELGYPGVQVRFIQAEPPAGWARPAAPAPAASTLAAPASAPIAPAAASPSAAASAPPPPPAVESKPAKASVAKEDFKNDPLIKQALEIFKGQIDEVRA
jgi:hypothetical protein